MLRSPAKIITLIAAAAIISMVLLRITNASTMLDTTLYQQLLSRVEGQFPRLMPAGFIHSDIWLDLKTKGLVTRTGKDEDLRPIFVKLQAAFETALLSMVEDGTMTATQAHIIIHTPMPATPACFEIDAKADLAPSIAGNPASLATITERGTLYKGVFQHKIPVTCFYPHGGREQRSTDAQRHYGENLAKFASLHDFPVASLNKIPTKQIGATNYIYYPDGTPAGIFFIRTTQSTDTNNKQWIFGYFIPGQGSDAQAIADETEHFLQDNGLEPKTYLKHA